MANPEITKFMAGFPFEGLTFDDVTMHTEYADFQPAEASVKSLFTRNIHLHIPFVSAAMDTVTESGMAIAMALQGGIGVLHKNMTPERQADEVRRVKTYLNGLIATPVVFRKQQLVSELLSERDARKYTFSGFPIIDDDGHLVGILTARDLKFVSEFNVTVASIMTTPVITAPAGTTLAQAYAIMTANRVGKLPIVDPQGRLAGLYSYHDVKSLMANDEPNVNRDPQHKLRVAAAIGPGDLERAARLIAAGVDALVVDTAHGFTRGVLDSVKTLKRLHPQVDLVAGNIADGKAAKALLSAGADAIKVGVGPGSICTTRVVCGVGIPQLTAIYDVAEAVQGAVPVIGDGGIKYSGDVPKAMVVGASSVMMGGVLAGTQESPGDKIVSQGRTFVVYRGMGSLEAMKTARGSRERYSQREVDDPDKLVPQGVEGLVPYRGRVDQVLGQFAGALQFTLGYCGAHSLDELRARARFVRVTMAGLREAHPHDIRMTKDAPNYRASEATS